MTLPCAIISQVLLMIAEERGLHTVVRLLSKPPLSVRLAIIDRSMMFLPLLHILSLIILIAAPSLLLPQRNRLVILLPLHLPLRGSLLPKVLGCQSSG